MDGQSSNEYTLLLEINNLIARMRECKPNDRSAVDRVYAVSLTDLEKVAAYWYVRAIEAHWMADDLPRTYQPEATK